MAFHERKGGKTSPFRREKERLARKFQINLEAIIAKYDKPFVNSDVLNLNDMTVVDDRGFLGHVKRMKVGTVKLAAEKASARSGICWNSTKESTDSAFGSTRYSESEDQSGTETITDSKYQNPRYVGATKRETTDLRLEDVLTRNGCQSGDSGNEEADSDHSGPICTPSKSPLRASLRHPKRQDLPRDMATHSSHQSARGNLSRRFDAESGVALKNDTSKRGMPRRLKSVDEDENEADEEDAEDDDDDPYEFREELPSILEEKNRFLHKMQSILIDSFIDGDELDETDSQTDDDDVASTGTMESSDATSGSISAWSTLPSKTTPKKTTESLKICQQDDLRVDKVRQDIFTRHIQTQPHTQRLPETHAFSSTDSDCTDCSTILAGNLHNDREVFHPSHFLQGKNPKRDSVSNIPSQPPFQAVCNSTMLSEINPPGDGTPNRETPPDLEQHRGLEMPLHGQGEMCLGEVPFLDPSDLKPGTVDREARRTKAGTDLEYNTPAKLRLHQKSQKVKGRENIVDEDLDETKSRTPSTKSRNPQDVTMNATCQDSSGFTPRARLKKGVRLGQTQTSLSSPRFDTREIIEIFKSPKPLVIPGVDLDSLDVTPRRKAKRGDATTPTGPCRSTLLRLQSPASRHKAKEIRPQSESSAHEMTLRWESPPSEVATVKEQSSEDLVRKSSVHLEINPNSESRNVEIKKDADVSFEAVNIISPEICRGTRSSAHLKGNRRKPLTSEPAQSRSEISQESVQRLQALSPADATHAFVSQAAGATKRQTQGKPNSRTCPNEQGVTDLKGHGQSAQSNTHQAHHAKKHSRSQHSAETRRATRSARLDEGSDSDHHVHPTSGQSASQNREAKRETSSKSLPSKHEPKEDVRKGAKQKGNAALVSPKSCPLTPTVERSPTTLSSPLNHMSIVSPPDFYGRKKHKLVKDSASNRSHGLNAQEKERVSSVKRAKSKVKCTEENLEWKGRTHLSGDKARSDRTHMTIRLSDDSSEEEMEIEVDPYSLTADDSSPGPRLHHERSQLYPASKRSSAKQDRHREKDIYTKDSEGHRRSYSTAMHQSKDRVQQHGKDLTKDHKKTPTRTHKKTLTKDALDSELQGSKKKSQSSGSLGKSCSLKNAENLAGKKQSNDKTSNLKSPKIRKQERGSIGLMQSPHIHSPPSSPEFTDEDSAILPKHKQHQSSKFSSKVAARREHTTYYSDEECNSSGDFATFLSSIPTRSGSNFDSHPSTQSSIHTSPKPRKLYYTEHTGGSKHKTTIRCGQIISTPKSAKGSSMASPDLHKTGSPSRSGRVEKTRKMLYNSPTRLARSMPLDSENSSVRKPGRTDHGRSHTNSAAWKLLASPSSQIASPSSRQRDVCRETSELPISSPLRASGCNVSSSYSCEGPGHCTKSFCFNCALTEPS